MSFTYDLSTSVGKVRLLIGDTVQTDYFLGDEEISSFLLMNLGNIKLSAADAAEAIAARLTREVDKSVGELSIQLGQRSQKFLELARRLRSQATSALSGYAGGISVSDKTYNESDGDRVVSAFKRGLMSEGDGDGE